MVNTKTLLDMEGKESILYAAVKEIKIIYIGESMKQAQVSPRTTFNNIWDSQYKKMSPKDFTYSQNILHSEKSIQSLWKNLWDVVFSGVGRLLSLRVLKSHCSSLEPLTYIEDYFRCQNTEFCEFDKEINCNVSKVGRC